MKYPKPNDESKGWLYYDGNCALCSDGLRTVQWVFPKLGIRTKSLHDPEVIRRLGFSAEKRLHQGWMITPEGKLIGGAEIWHYILGRVWWGFPFRWLAAMPGGRWLIDRTYRWVAANRYRIVEAWRKAKGWLPLAILLPFSLTLRDALPPWALMWLLCFILFFGCKWLTWWRARTGGWIGAGYLLAWPGMDANTFFNRSARVPKPAGSSWLAAISKTAMGAVLLWAVARQIPSEPLAAWTGMIGLMFLLHFGSFDLLALAWQRAGIDARPIMRAPILATSLSEFWSVRWNLAFRQLCRDFVFRPVLARAGSKIATLAVFLVSGLVHELVISVPAGGGYGLPTAYFTLQGIAVLFEHSKIGRKLKIDHGAGGWLFTLLLTAGPAYWLFHPLFIDRVIVPFLKTIHALGGGGFS